jgi:Response regulator containing a CheY-like receiver domain and an HTH DNA-binding domain
MHAILEDEPLWFIKVVAKAPDKEEIEKYLTEIRPEFLFLDNRTLDLDIHELLNLIDEKSPGTKIILFSSHIEDELDSPIIIRITENTYSPELIEIIKGKRAKKVKHLDKNRYDLTETELKIVDLIGAGLSNKEIAKILSLKEKKVKTHLTHIYMRLGVQNRYQLMVYAKRFECGNTPK